MVEGGGKGELDSDGASKGGGEGGLKVELRKDRRPLLKEINAKVEGLRGVSVPSSLDANRTVFKKYGCRLRMFFSFFFFFSSCATFIDCKTVVCSNTLVAS